MLLILLELVRFMHINLRQMVNIHKKNTLNTSFSPVAVIFFFSSLVCQFRLDFKQLTLRNPPSNGQCILGDMMQVSTAGEVTPIICGKNNSMKYDFFLIRQKFLPLKIGTIYSHFQIIICTLT